MGLAVSTQSIVIMWTKEMVNIKALCKPKVGNCKVNVIMGTSSVTSSPSAPTPRTRDLRDRWDPRTW